MHECPGPHAPFPHVRLFCCCAVCHYFDILIFSHSHILICSHSHILVFFRWGNSHILAFSHSHILIFPYSHILTFSCSHIRFYFYVPCVTSVLCSLCYSHCLVLLFMLFHFFCDVYFRGGGGDNFEEILAFFSIACQNSWAEPDTGGTPRDQ